MRFDAVKYFESRNIRFWTSGNNVTRGWVNITCPFCGDHEYSGNNHLGVSTVGSFNCWICHEKGHISKLIRKIEKCSWGYAKEIRNKFLTFDIDDHEYEKTEFKLPSGIFDKPLNRHIRYLHNRRFDKDIIERYDLKFGHDIGKWKWSIIIPILINGRWVSFVSADITRKKSNKYKSCPIELSEIPSGQCVYNLDNISGRKVIVVEGILDCWRIGDNCLSLMGTKYHTKQIEFIYKSGIEDIYIMFDSDDAGKIASEKLGNYLSGLFRNVEILEINVDDPDSLSFREVEKIKKIIGLKNI